MHTTEGTAVNFLHNGDFSGQVEIRDKAGHALAHVPIEDFLEVTARWAELHGAGPALARLELIAGAREPRPPELVLKSSRPTCDICGLPGDPLQGNHLTAGDCAAARLEAAILAEEYAARQLAQVGAFFKFIAAASGPPVTPPPSQVREGILRGTAACLGVDPELIRENLPHLFPKPQQETESETP